MPNRDQWRQQLLGDEAPVSWPRRKLDQAELDITPMIDITFLLLIFFLVASTPDRDTAVDLASARFGRGVSEHESVILTVAVAAGNDVPPEVYLADGKHVEGRLVADPVAQEEAIRRAILTARDRDGKSHVLIKAEKGVKFRQVQRIAAAASVDGVGLHLAVFEVE